MLKKVLAISGKSGLYELISYGKNMIVLKSLVDGKRLPAYSRDKIISLGDISMYTTGDDVPLGQVMQSIFDKFDGKAIDTKKYETAEQIHDFFIQVLPDYDQDRVYKSDIKKVINWYNLLVGAGYTSFLPEKEETSEGDNADEKKDE